MEISGPLWVWRPGGQYAEVRLFQFDHQYLKKKLQQSFLQCPKILTVLNSFVIIFFKIPQAFFLFWSIFCPVIPLNASLFLFFPKINSMQLWQTSFECISIPFQYHLLQNVHKLLNINKTIHSVVVLTPKYCPPHIYEQFSPILRKLSFASKLIPPTLLLAVQRASAWQFLKMAAFHLIFCDDWRLCCDWLGCFSWCHMTWF